MAEEGQIDTMLVASLKLYRKYSLQAVCYQMIKDTTSGDSMQAIPTKSLAYNGIYLSRLSAEVAVQNNY